MQIKNMRMIIINYSEQDLHFSFVKTSRFKPNQNSNVPSTIDTNDQRGKRKESTHVSYMIGSEIV